MINAAVINKCRLGAIALAAGLVLSAAPISYAHGGGGGGTHGGGFSGGHGGGFGAAHGGRSDFGGRGGFGHHHFGHGGFGFYGLGFLGYGLFFDTLPLYYSTYWWGGSPYYYANGNFYQWNGSLGEYETVVPPQNLASQVATTQALGNASLFAYPKSGQTSAQQATDRIACQRWATGQTGTDPSAASSTVPVAASAEWRQDYIRAESACLEGRGYSVR